MMTPARNDRHRLLEMVNDSILKRFWTRISEALSAIEVSVVSLLLVLLL